MSQSFIGAFFTDASIKFSADIRVSIFSTRPIIDRVGQYIALFFLIGFEFNQLSFDIVVTCLCQDEFFLFFSHLLILPHLLFPCVILLEKVKSWMGKSAGSKWDINII